MTLDQLTTPITVNEAKDSIYTALGTAGITTTQWGSGAVVRSLIYVFALMLSVVSQVTAYVARSGFTAFARGDWLTNTAKYVYGVDRIEATYAAGTLRLSNTGGGVYSLAARALIVKRATVNSDGTKPEYVNQSSFTLGAGSVAVPTVLDISILAIEPGTRSSALAGTITEFTTPLLKVTCTNLADILATDQEDDSQLALRCGNKLGSLSPFGPYDAYTYAATTAVTTSGASSGITRLGMNADGFGNIYIYAATATGSSTGVTSDPNTPLGAAWLAMQNKALPIGTDMILINAAGTSFTLTYDVWIYSTAQKTSTEIAAAILAAVNTSIYHTPVGGNKTSSVAFTNGTYYLDDLKTAIFSTFPEIFRVTLTSPSSDQTISYDNVLITPTSVTANIHIVAPPAGYSGASVG
jgi:hypothetical protein